MDPKVWQWQRTIDDGRKFIISTDRSLLPHDFVQKAFDNPAMYWAKPLLPTNMETLLSNSCTLGLYRLSGDKSPRTPIGMARMVTDYVTLAYLTDVYIDAEYRSLGLGKWLIRCCREIVLEMPGLRFMILLTGSEQARQLYRKELGMVDMGSEETLAAMGARRPRLEEAAASSS